jgi:hypothetical protein
MSGCTVQVFHGPPVFIIQQIKNHTGIQLAQIPTTYPRKGTFKFRATKNNSIKAAEETNNKREKNEKWELNSRGNSLLKKDKKILPGKFFPGRMGLITR